MDPARPSFQLNGPGAAGGNLWSGPFLQFGAGGSAAARSLLAQSRSFQFEIRQPRQSTGGRPTLRCTKNKSARSGSVVRSQGRGGSPVRAAYSPGRAVPVTGCPPRIGTVLY